MSIRDRFPFGTGLSRRVQDLEAAVRRLEDELADARAQGRRIADIADVVVEELAANSDEARQRLHPGA